jgi:hypothetical protein
LQIFLMDNSPTMEDHWDEARDLLKVLLKKCRKIDEDGIDVLFTTSHENHNSKDVDQLMHHIDSGRHHPRSSSEPTDIAAKLEGIFNLFNNTTRPAKRHGSRFDQRRLQHVETKIKPATLLFLTDGQWQAREKVELVIKNFLRTLYQSLDSRDERPFTIEFIHLGDDPDAANFLDYLDDFLCEEPMMYVILCLLVATGAVGLTSSSDVIDTEPARGDIYKMLLGSLDKHYDNLDQGLFYIDDVSQLSETRDSVSKDPSQVDIRHVAPSPEPVSKKNSKSSIWTRGRKRCSKLWNWKTTPAAQTYPGQKSHLEAGKFAIKVDSSHVDKIDEPKSTGAQISENTLQPSETTQNGILVAEDPNHLCPDSSAAASRATPNGSSQGIASVTTVQQS